MGDPHVAYKRKTKEVEELTPEQIDILGWKDIMTMCLKDEDPQPRDRMSELEFKEGVRLGLLSKWTINHPFYAKWRQKYVKED